MTEPIKNYDKQIKQLVVKGKKTNKIDQKEIFKLIQSGFFSPHDVKLFAPIVQALAYHDPYLVCADFESYCRTQDQVSKLYLDKDEWTQKSIINVAQSGYFSSDRTIREYAKDIWHVPVI